MQNYSEIVQNVFVGNKHALDHSHNFSLIINCTHSIPFQPSLSEFIRISINDREQDYDLMFHAILSNNILSKIYEHSREGKVLINCNQGQQRSCALCACYLICYYRYTPDRAIKYIKQKRPLAFDGSVNFMKTIKKFNNKKYKVMKKY